MDIKSVEIEHSNPSMGPHEVVTSYTLSIAGYEKELEGFLREIEVNGRVPLGAYLAFLAEDKTAEAEEVRQAFEPDSLRSGETISDLKFSLASGKTLVLSDLRTFKLGGFYGSDFLKLLVEKGHKYQSSSGGSPFAEEEKPLRLDDEIRRTRVTPADEIRRTNVIPDDDDGDDDR